MKCFLMLMVMILSVSCKDDKNSRYGFDSKDYKENHIDFIHGIMLLPKDYSEMSEEEFLFYAEKSNHVTSIAVRMMDFSQGSKFDYVGYTKENNLNDLVLVHSGEYVNFSKRNAD